MATVEKMNSNKKLSKGIRLEIITREYKNTGEEPHFHLLAASHRDRDVKANNYDLITRVKVTDDLPETKDDIVVIKDNPPIEKNIKRRYLDGQSKPTNAVSIIAHWLKAFGTR